MQENDETGNTLTADYTFHPRFALGLYAKRDIGERHFYTIGPQLNTLIKRWNLPEGQGNIFSMTGAGTARQGSNTQPAAWVALLADYETRRVFFSYEPRLMYSGNIETSFWQRAQLGFAPYLAGDSFTLADCAAHASLPIIGLATKSVLGADLLEAGGVAWKPYAKFIGQRASARRSS